MKKKYFSIIFLIFVVAAITLTSDPSVKVMKRMFFTGATETEKKEITIVIDPGHPRTRIGKEASAYISSLLLFLCI